jgi:hypothetical protein
MVQAISVRTSLTDESVDMLQEILDDDEGLAKQASERASASEELNIIQFDEDPRPWRGPLEVGERGGAEGKTKRQVGWDLATGDAE